MQNLRSFKFLHVHEKVHRKEFANVFEWAKAGPLNEVKMVEKTIQKELNFDREQLPPAHFPSPFSHPKRYFFLKKWPKKSFSSLVFFHFSNWNLLFLVYFLVAVGKAKRVAWNRGKRKSRTHLRCSLQCGVFFSS